MTVEHATLCKGAKTPCRLTLFGGAAVAWCSSQAQADSETVRGSYVPISCPQWTWHPRRKFRKPLRNITASGDLYNPIATTERNVRPWPSNCVMPCEACMSSTKSQNGKPEDAEIRFCVCRCDCSGRVGAAAPTGQREDCTRHSQHSGVAGVGRATGCAAARQRR